MNCLKYITVCFLIFFATASLHAQPESVSRLYTTVEQYQADVRSLERAFVLEESPKYFDRMEQLHNSWLNRLNEMDYSDLNTSEAVDFILLRRNIQRDLQELQQSRSSYNDIKPTIRFADIIQNLQEKRRVGADIEGSRFAEQLDSLAETVRKNKEQIKDQGRLEPHETRRSVEVVKNLRQTLENVFTFYDGYDPDVTWWAPESYEEADTTLSNYAAFLEEWTVDQSHKDDGSGIIGDPVGREKLLELLDYEMIPYTPEELIGLAEKEYQWCLDQMLQASEDLGYGEDWHAALEHTKNTYVPPGKQPEVIYDLAIRAIEFLEERDLLTIPELAKETWSMEMMTPERQLINPFFLGGRVIRISYPTNTMDYEAKMMSMRGNNPNFSNATVHHELIAGHHLQGFMTDRYHPYRDAFRTPFWIEGWALYWELQLWDMDFPETPEERIGMLYWRMHRAARIIFSLRFHLGEMSPQEAIDFIVEKVGHEYKNAEAEVRRSFEANYPPLYQAAYMLGGLQIRALYNELVENGDMSDKNFHDRILKNGNMPIEMVRKILTEQKPPKDFETNWRFYEELN